MATSNKIVYTFVAVDKFTATANKIRKSIAAINRPMDKVGASFKKEFQQPLEKSRETIKKTNAELKKVVETFNKAPTPIKRSTSFISRFTSGIGNAAKHLIGFSHSFTVWADKFGMEAYFKFMNIALPMGIVAHLGLEYSNSLNSARISMDSLFSKTKDYAKYQKIITQEATKFATTTPFSRAEFMEATQGIAIQTGSAKLASQFMPFVVGYSALMGKYKKGALPQVASELISSIMQGRIGKLPISTAQQEELSHIVAGPASQRFQRALEWFYRNQSMFMKAEKKLYHTSAVQAAIVGSQFRKLSGTIVDTLEPSFEGLRKGMIDTGTVLSKFIQRHKGVTNALGTLAFAVTGLLGSLITFAAIAGGASLAFSALNPVILATATALGMIGIAVERFIKSIPPAVHTVQTYTHSPRKFFHDVGNVMMNPGAFLDYLTGHQTASYLQIEHNLMIKNESGHPISGGVKAVGSAGLNFAHTVSLGRNTGSFNHE